MAEIGLNCGQHQPHAVRFCCQSKVVANRNQVLSEAVGCTNSQCDICRYWSQRWMGTPPELRNVCRREGSWIRCTVHTRLTVHGEAMPSLHNGIITWQKIAGKEDRLGNIWPLLRWTSLFVVLWLEEQLLKLEPGRGKGSEQSCNKSLVLFSNITTMEMMMVVGK